MSDINRCTNLNEDHDADNNDDDEQRWYNIRSSLSLLPFNGNNNKFISQSSSTTMGSWGFDVNRSTNGQIPSSFTTNNNSNNGQHAIMRTTKDYDEHLVDIPSPLSLENFTQRTPLLPRHHNGNEFATIDRFVLGLNQASKSNDYLPDDLFQQKMILNNSSRLNPKNQRKIKTEQELIAWQNRMLERLILIFIKY